MMCTPTQDVWQPAGCVSCELVCVCVSLVRVVIICLASTHTALVSSPSLTVLHLTTYIHAEYSVNVCERVCYSILRKALPVPAKFRLNMNRLLGFVASASPYTNNMHIRIWRCLFVILLRTCKNASSLICCLFIK